jgi:hypothetical protein
VTTATTASLATLLRLVEQWQDDSTDAAILALDAVDVSALRAEAQQHAAALRRFDEGAGWDVLKAAADFLSPPEENPQ